MFAVKERGINGKKSYRVYSAQEINGNTRFLVRDPARTTGEEWIWIDARDYTIDTSSVRTGSDFSQYE